MAKKYRGQPAPVWREYLQEANARLARRHAQVDAKGFPQGVDWIEAIAAEIVRHGSGEAFLKSVRRGRPTRRQEIRYQLLREVEKLIGAGVKRRREDRNTPDSVELKAPLRLELEG